MESRKIALSAINSEDKRYQVRDSRAGSYSESIKQERDSRDHINSIVKAIFEGKKPTPIEVIEDPTNNGKYIIVDGFHRYGAYTKVRNKTKGARYKQVTVKVYTEGVPLERALTINTEHTALTLTTNQRTELQWQQFLTLMQQEKEPSKKETVQILGLADSTIGNWRRLRKEFEEAGFFKNNSNVAKNPITGLPMLKPSRDELKRCDDWSITEETDGALTEEDQKTAHLILSKAKTAKEPEKLRQFIQLFWGDPVDAVDFNIKKEDFDEIAECDF